MPLPQVPPGALNSDGVANSTGTLDEFIKLILLAA